MAVSSFWKKCKRGVRAAFEFVWGYMGTLAAMGLVVGVLGMGLFHEWSRDSSGPEYRCFTGLINCSCAKAPTGLGEVPKGEVGPHLRFEYGPAGRLSRLVYIGADGRRAAMPCSKVAEQRMEYDAAGRLVGKRNFSVSGESAEDASGISARLFAYDSQGRLVRTTLLNAHGQKIVPRMPGYAEECITYDGKGRPLRIQYLDGFGNPVTNSSGEREIVFAYDDTHHVVVRTNLIEGKAAENHAGFAIERRNRTEDGSSELVSWHDKEGKPVQNSTTGAFSMLAETRQKDHLQRWRLCGENGVMPDASRSCAEHLVRTTADGKTEWECYNAADGLPCINARLGYAERVCEYDKKGDLKREYFWDGEGRPCPCYEKRYTLAENGLRHVLALHTDGSTSLQPVE